MSSFLLTPTYGDVITKFLASTVFHFVLGMELHARARGGSAISELKIRRRRESTTADLVEGAWSEVAVAMARKIALRKLARRRVVVAPFPVEV